MNYARLKEQIQNVYVFVTYKLFDSERYFCVIFMVLAVYVKYYGAISFKNLYANTVTLNLMRCFIRS